jgi:polynucleotide 5'-kinase involved in rRNA processing
LDENHEAKPLHEYRYQLFFKVEGRRERLRQKEEELEQRLEEERRNLAIEANRIKEARDYLHNMRRQLKVENILDMMVYYPVMAYCTIIWQIISINPNPVTWYAIQWAPKYILRQKYIPFLHRRSYHAYEDGI